MYFSQEHFETYANLIMRDHVIPVDLPEALFEFPYERVVEIHKTLNCGTRQDLGIRAALISEARELGFRAGR